MQKKRLVALIMTVVLSLGIFSVPASAASGDIELTFSLTNVSGEVPTLELGLNVTTGGEEKFKSVGVVLEFDNTVLELIPWNTYVGYPLSYATDWSTAVPIGTKGIDEYMGSGSQAYTAGDKTYLYLSAEAIIPEVLSDGTRVATVRFAYKDGKSAADVNADTVKLAEDDEVVFASPIQHGAVYHNDVDFYYYNPLTVNSGGEINSDAEIGAEYILSKPTFEQVTAGESIVPVGDGVNMDNVLSVAFYDWDETLLGILAVPKGEDISQRVNDYVRSFIHPELNDRVEDGEVLSDSDISNIMSSNARQDTYRGKYPGTYGNDSTIDLTGSSYPLTNKLDYVFYKGDTTAPGYDGYYFAHGWIPVTTQTLDGRAENGVFTAYDSPEAASDASPVDFSKGLTDSIMVKAAYVPGELLKMGKTDLTEAYYTITNIAYNRYGKATDIIGSYSMIATVERINKDGYGVTRLRCPAYYVTVTPSGAGAQDVAIRIDLDSKDEAKGEVVSPRLSYQTIIRYIDVNDDNWLGVDHKAASSNILCAGEQGYLQLGTVTAVNEAIKDLYEGAITGSDFTKFLDDITRSDLELVINSSTIGGIAFFVNENARFKFMLGYAASCGQQMDRAYLDGILRMVLTTPNLYMPTSTANYDKALANVLTAVASNGNMPLTVEQTAYAINNNGALLTS